MNVRNFLNSDMNDEPNCHDGHGILKHISLFENNDFLSKLRFINYTILPIGSSIGLHTHQADEEIYIILEGQGLMTVDTDSKQVLQGDVIVNRPFGSHELINNSDVDLKILVFEVGI